MLVRLDQKDACDGALVGAKAARLSRLAGEFPVPPGFCLTTAAFEQWVAEEQPEAVPQDIGMLLDRAYQEFAARVGTAAPRVAVRSSGADEDGQNTSSAGQYETFLNVTGVTELRKAVLRCWQSAHTPRVRAYRQQHSQKPGDIRVAVLIQELIAADISIVAFSVNPVTGDQTEVVINAVWGLGPSLADGTATPDNYIVSKSDLTLIRRDIGAKERMTILKPSGVEEVAVPRMMRSQAVLNEKQVTEIARMARTLEAEAGWPADIECVFRGETLLLLQCRPVTTL